RWGEGGGARQAADPGGNEPLEDEAPKEAGEPLFIVPRGGWRAKILPQRTFLYDCAAGSVKACAIYGQDPLIWRADIYSRKTTWRNFDDEKANGAGDRHGHRHPRRRPDEGRLPGASRRALA